jgi:hypothetical protein
MLPPARTGLWGSGSLVDADGSAEAARPWRYDLNPVDALVIAIDVPLVLYQGYALSDLLAAASDCPTQGLSGNRRAA